MEEKNKEQGASSPTSEEKDTKEFVEIKGEKYQVDPETKKPLLDDDGNLVPFKSEEDKKEGDIDYKAELEKANEKIAKQNKSLNQAGYKIRELEDKSLDENKVKELIKESISEVYSKFSEKEAKDMAYSMTDSPDEAKLTLFHYKNSILKTGNLAEDMANANALANRGKLTKKVEEMGRILITNLITRLILLIDFLLNLRCKELISLLSYHLHSCFCETYCRRPAT